MSMTSNVDTPVVSTTPPISLSTLKTDIASVLSAIVGLVVGLGVLTPGIGQDVLSIGGVMLAAVFQIVGALNLRSKVKAAANGVGVK